MYSKYDPRECERCGKVHICTGTVQCPCFEVEINDKFLEYISSHFDECLCLTCMEELKGNFTNP